MKVRHSLLYNVDVIQVHSAQLQQQLGLQSAIAVAQEEKNRGRGSRGTLAKARGGRKRQRLPEKHGVEAPAARRQGPRRPQGHGGYRAAFGEERRGSRQD